MAFAKLWGENDKQILLKIDSGDEGPELRVFFEPPGLGVCSCAINFEDSDEGWSAAEKAFGDFTEEAARKIAEEISAKYGERL
jgi:hypothetical protein